MTQVQQRVFFVFFFFFKKEGKKNGCIRCKNVDAKHKKEKCEERKKNTFGWKKLERGEKEEKGRNR